MKKIRDFKEGDRIRDVYLVNEVKNGTTAKGSPYLTVVLQDNTGMMEGKFWDVKEEDRQLIQTGRLVNFSFEVLMYNKNLQIRINKALPADMSQVSMDDYVIVSQQSEEKRRSDVAGFISSIHNPVYHQLTQGMIDYVGDLYFTFPAASRIHHNYMGGLSEHSLSMTQMAEEVCRHYPQLNRDLLISATLIHDVGKTAEMSGAVTTEYTLEGRLEGHISLANGWLNEVAAKLHLEDKEETVLLHHMILSHHGHYEYGSPVLPMLIEAEALSLIDNLDARMNTLKQALDAVQPGNWTTKLFALENRQFYKPKG